jgi:phage-related protein
MNIQCRHTLSVYFDAQLFVRVVVSVYCALAEHGQSLSQTYMKHIDGDIWELRPIRDRIFFVAWKGDGFLLLHHFVKKSQRTPQKEIETAKRRYIDAIAQEADKETENNDDEE